jgi:hypothetical protein
MTIARAAISATLGVIIALGASAVLSLASAHPVVLVSALYAGVFLGGLTAGIIARQAIIGLVVGAYFYRPGMTEPADAMLMGLLADPEMTRIVAVAGAVVVALAGCLAGQMAIARFARPRFA